MKAQCGILLVLVAAGTALPQSLAEVAEKERERREKLGDGKVYKVYNEDDLARASGNASVTGSPPEPERRKPGEEDALDRRPERASDWDEVWRSCQQRFARAKAARNQALQTFVEGLPIMADAERMPCVTILARHLVPGYVRHALSCEELQKDMEKHDATMKAIQEECLNEARKRRVPPGEARLQ